MASKSNMIPQKKAVELGNLRVEFLGTKHLMQPVDIHSSPLHLHSKHEFQYIISGTMSENVNGDQLEDIPPDTVLLIPPNMLHSNPTCDGERMVATLVLQKIAGSADEAAFSEYAHYCALFGAFREPLVFQDSLITHYVRQYIALEDLPENAHKKNTLLSMLFISLADHIKHSSLAEAGQYPFEPGTQYNQQYFLTDHYINSHYTQKTSIQELADYLHVSRRQADRIVCHIFGKSYAELILLRRMSIAQMLLQKTDMPCTQIAEKVGYGSYAGFYIAFQKHFGISPEQMRNNALSSNP